MLTLPTIVFALVVAVLCGALYHLIRGGNGWRLLLFIGLSIFGFAAGQFLGSWLGWRLFLVGSLDLGAGILGSILFLIGGEWLSMIETRDESSV